MRSGVVSIVLPVYNQADHIAAVVADYVARLDGEAIAYELILVVNGSRDRSEEVCRSMAQGLPQLRVLVSKDGGWGLAVRLGLAAARGDLLCYTNSARTAAGDLCTVVRSALARPDTVVKAVRIVRGSILRRAGSALFNFECRILLGVRVRDVNGTPKVFPASILERLRLAESGDLVDAELCARCARLGLPIVEVPLVAGPRHGGTSTTRLGSAWRMYRGVWRLRGALR